MKSKIIFLDLHIEDRKKTIILDSKLIESRMKHKRLENRVTQVDVATRNF
ncbi:hypothetical protein ENLAB_11260 [Enterococcus innesii]|uniref:Uncharacterized protein n=1 Tax=Enterococcus innesii TaxID=2839759 RepID=A0ABM7XR81_9ENTE|nr:hypothetical protein ENLAB_11260 [Enterococcus innesii]